MGLLERLFGLLLLLDVEIAVVWVVLRVVQSAKSLSLAI